MTTQNATLHAPNIDGPIAPAPRSGLGRWTPLVTILPVGLGLIGASHYYLWARLVRDVGFAPTAAHVLTAVLCILAASIPLGVIASRVLPARWSAWWLAPVYLWIGTSFFLTIYAGAIDLLRLVFGTMSHWSGASIALIVSALGAATAAWAIREARRLRVERVEIPLRKLDRELDGLRIVQLSDLHIGPTLGRRFLEDVVARVNQLEPDAIVITGDLVDASVADLRDHVAPLADLVAKHGTFFVTGNHEYHAGAREWCEHLGTLGVRVLRNEHVALDREGHVVHLAGIDDYEAAHFDIGHRADLAAAVAGRDPSRPLVLLAHQPRAVHEAVRYGVDLQLSGHTHGGQVWPLTWLVRGSGRFGSGLARLADTFVYVSRGTGHSGPPMRLGAPPEISEILLRAA